MAGNIVSLPQDKVKCIITEVVIGLAVPENNKVRQNKINSLI
jgi:hypothetical protein